jgi:MFS family permease
MPIAFALLCVQLDFFSLSLALPTIAAGLGESVTDLQWLLSAYMLALGAFVVPAGRFGDLAGRRLALIIGLSIFAVTSLVSGLSQEAWMLIASRAVQGLGAALIMPNAYALVSNNTTEAARPGIFGVLIGVAGLGTAAGPVVGGVLSATIGWPWVFWINLPFVLVALLGTLRLAESRNEGASRSLDWLGIVTVVLGLALLSLGIDNVPPLGWLSPFSLGLMVVGLAVLGVFVFAERRAVNPLVHPVLLRNRPYVALLIVGTIGNMGVNVVILMATFTLQSVLGYPPEVAGWLFLAASIGVAVAGPVAGWCCSRFPAPRVLAVATIVSAVGLASMLLSEVLPVYLAAMFPASAGEAASFLLMPLVALGGLGMVVITGIVEAAGAGKPTMPGIDAVLVGFAGILAVAGGALLVAERVGALAPRTATAA